MLSLQAAAKAAHAAASTDWSNAGTATGTIALAVVTFVTLLCTVIATTTDRKQAAADRADAEKRLEDERAAGEQRIRDERAHADEVRRRDRQIANAAGLVARVAELQAFMTGVPGSSLRAERPSMSAHSRNMADEETLHAVSSLRHGAWTEAAMLGTSAAAEAAAERYRTLVRLVDEAARTHPFPDRDLVTLRNYARWVLISLRTLAENETVPPNPGAPERHCWDSRSTCLHGSPIRSRRDGTTSRRRTLPCASRRGWTRDLMSRRPKLVRAEKHTRAPI